MRKYDHGFDVLSARAQTRVAGAGHPVKDWYNTDYYAYGDIVYYDQKYWRAIRDVKPPFITAFMSGDEPGHSDAWMEITQAQAGDVGGGTVSFKGKSEVLGRGGHGHHGGHGGRGRGGWGGRWWGGGPGYFDDDYDPSIVLVENPEAEPDVPSFPATDDGPKWKYDESKTGLNNLINYVEWDKQQKAKTQVVGYVAPQKPTFGSSPAAMQAELDSVKREGEQLDKDIRGSSVSADFKSAWSVFWAGFGKFYSDTGWWDRLWEGTGNKIVAYGNQLNDWRMKFASIGGNPIEPKAAPVVRREDPSEVPWKPIIIGSVVVVGLFAGGYALSKAIPAISLFRRKSA